MLELNNTQGTYGYLVGLVKQRYYNEIMGQIHRIIGSADFLGNPVGLFNTVSSGVVDSKSRLFRPRYAVIHTRLCTLSAVFYEPLQGFSSDRPEDFGTGFAKGAKSFARKTVYGFSDTFAKMSGSFGKGMRPVVLPNDSAF
jgi:vacuolar protein sorting-associated protein 13A/C